ncbi:hypothetical protein BGZ58_007006 [Dissophora ornata]|nr:hypothetical protein BGZ58_007006 [Dissophora ornata]
MSAPALEVYNASNHLEALTALLIRELPKFSPYAIRIAFTWLIFQAALYAFLPAGHLLPNHIARSTNGECMIWGKPAKVIRTSFVTSDGKTHKSLLLCSGYWGISRHFNYVGDLLISLAIWKDDM